MAHAFLANGPDGASQGFGAGIGQADVSDFDQHLTANEREFRRRCDDLDQHRRAGTSR